MAERTKEQWIADSMKTMGWTEKEALDVWETDRAIDKGANPFPQTDEQKKVSQKYAKAGVRKTPTVYKFTQRERKENATKAGLIQEFYKFLMENSEFDVKNCEITNKERMIAFAIGDEKYEITLIQKRKPKK